MGKNVNVDAGQFRVGMSEKLFEMSIIQNAGHDNLRVVVSHDAGCMRMQFSLSYEQIDSMVNALNLAKKLLSDIRLDLEKEVE